MNNIDLQVLQLSSIYIPRANCSTSKERICDNFRVIASNYFSHNMNTSVMMMMGMMIMTGVDLEEGGGGAHSLLKKRFCICPRMISCVMNIYELAHVELLTGLLQIT